MFDIGGSEALLLIVLGLLIFGPRRLPQIGRQLGGFVAQMRQGMREFQGTIEREVAFEEVRQATKQVTDVARQVQGAVSAELTGIGPPPYADPERRARQERSRPAGEVPEDSSGPGDTPGPDGGPGASA